MIQADNLGFEFYTLAYKLTKRGVRSASGKKQKNAIAGDRLASAIAVTPQVARCRC